MTPSHSLPSELSIYTVGELRAQWLTWLAAAGADAAAGASPHDDAFAVDAAAVGEVDSAGVQLLLSLSQALRREQRALRLLNPSQPLADACAALGAQALLAAAETTGAPACTT